MTLIACLILIFTFLQMVVAMMNLLIEIYSDTVSNKYALMLNHFPDDKNGLMFVTASQWNPNDDMSRKEYSA